MNMNIRKYLGTPVLATALLLASAIPGLAANSRKVTLPHDAVLSGTNLKVVLSAGQYTIQWETHSPEATVQFAQHHKVILSTEGRVVQRDKKYDRNSAVYNTAPDGTMSLVEIRFGGSRDVLVFNQ